MSESSEHRDIIALMACGLQIRYPNLMLETDLQIRPGDPVPQIIDGHRPDICARDNAKQFFLIGEAKTDAHLYHRHTHAQITSFVRHLESKRSGVFVLGVIGAKSDGAKTLLRFIHSELGLVNTSLQVFDGCDYWTLDKQGGIQWHLS